MKRFGLFALAVVVTPLAAEAFCGFYVGGADATLYNSASQVVLMRSGNRTVLTMQQNYDGPPQDFAMVVPVPVVLQREQVKTLPLNVFSHIDQLSAPRLVEYWEQDPCAPPAPEEEGFALGAADSLAGVRTRGAGGLGVRIEAQFVVGEYEIVILSASDSQGLETWLHLQHYNIPRGAAAVLAPYIREQSKFFVARVNIARVHRDDRGVVQLSPLRFHYDTPDFRLPVRLGLLNARGDQELIVYVLSPGQRYEVANYPNVFVPTNFDVADSVREQFGPFYLALFDEVVRRHEGRVVVTEYSWDSGSCDPCPTPPLEESELRTLGADVLGNAGGGWVLTRLHTRYNARTLTDDIVFRAAPAVGGGRENMVNQDALWPWLERGARPDGQNNFQSRYIIRHRWTGPIACVHPTRGSWGENPAGSGGTTAGGYPAGIRPAAHLAGAPRGAVALPTLLRQSVPEIGFELRRVR